MSEDRSVSPSEFMQQEADSIDAAEEAALKSKQPAPLGTVLREDVPRSELHNAIMRHARNLPHNERQAILVAVGKADARAVAAEAQRDQARAKEQKWHREREQFRQSAKLAYKRRDEALAERDELEKALGMAIDLAVEAEGATPDPARMKAELLTAAALSNQEKP